VTGPLALVGGDEFRPGNEPHDELLVEAAHRLDGERPCYVLATAAARQDPDRAVATATAWFAGLGLEVEELPLRRRGQASMDSTEEAARRGRFFYLCGGDPGLTVATLVGTPAWDAIVAAWQGGAVLAGSSAGAMAFGEWTLIRSRMPGDAERQARAALRLVPGLAVLPHFADFGHRWLESARRALPEATLLGIDARSAAVWDAGKWRVLGAGSVVVVRGSSRRTFASGETIPGLAAPSGVSPRVGRAT
jgi:cyanophycinase